MHHSTILSHPKLIIFIVGLPASGKTTLMNKFSDKFIKIDDITSLEQLPKTFSKLVITDPFLYNVDDRIAAEQHILNNYKNVKVRFIYFENNLTNCLKNADKRGTKRVEMFIARAHKTYTVPDSVRAIKVKQY